MIYASLEAVGFIAAIASLLAKHSISVNLISGYYHDHLFIPVARSQEAIILLKGLARSFEIKTIIMNQKIAIAELNQMSQTEFTEALGEIWEETPEIAERAWQSKPFENLEALYQAMVAMVNGMSELEQVALIKAHPDLGSKTQMAEASVQEQAGVGLNQLSESEYQQFQSLNQAYKNKFDFPFIIAVKEHTKESILQAFEARLENTQEREKHKALEEISKIARLRLQSLISGSKP